MKIRIIPVVMLLALSVVLWPAMYSVAATTQPAFQYAETITGNGPNKFPSAAVAGGQVQVSWANTNEANYASRAETAQGFAIANPPIGSIGSNSNYFNTALATDKNGVAHVVWIQDGSKIYHKSKSNGVWSSQQTVATGLSFANNITLIAASTGRLFAAWRYNGASPDGNIAFTYSDNAGTSWAAPADISLPAGTYTGTPRLAAGSSGQVFLTWTGVDGNVYVGEYNGSTFVPAKISNGSNFFNSSISVAPNGTPYVAWRNSTNGVYYGFRSNGQWTVQKVFAHPGVTGPVAIVVDAQSNIHLAWISQQAGDGKFDLWYSLKTPDDPWTTPLVVSRDGTAFKMNVNMVVSLNNGAALAHIFYESFQGGQFIRYSQVKTLIAPPITGQVIINGGATVTNQAGVTVTIKNTSSTPATAYSIADGADPGTPATTFSDPQTDTTLNLDGSDGQCRLHTVYARLASGSNVSAPFTGTILYDPSVRANVQARNPNSAFNMPLTGIGSAVVATGDVAYTRQERFNLSITYGPEECSGLKRYAVVARGAPAPASGSSAWKPFPSAGYVSANIDFMANAGQGTYQFDVYAEDNVGNVTQTPFVTQIVYDTEPPYVANMPADPTTTSDQPKGGVATIDVGSPDVTDNFYTDPASGRRYWGYWVVVKQSAAGAPSDDDFDTSGMIVNDPLPATLRWNMARGMVGPFVPGANYTVYIRYLDGAGNASAIMASQPVQVNQLEFFSYLSMIKR